MVERCKPGKWRCKLSSDCNSGLESELVSEKWARVEGSEKISTEISGLRGHFRVLTHCLYLILKKFLYWSWSHDLNLKEAETLDPKFLGIATKYLLVLEYSFVPIEQTQAYMMSGSWWCKDWINLFCTTLYLYTFRELIAQDRKAAVEYLFFLDEGVTN